MIEVTQEMIETYRKARSSLNHEQLQGRPPIERDTLTRAGIQAVLDLIERDYDVQPARCGATRTDDPDFAYEKCEGDRGHDGKHFWYPRTAGAIGCEQW